jgi:hypothetical protein
MLDSLARHGGRYTPGTVGVQASALRTYLRFWAARYPDRVDVLLAAIPTVALWRLASLSTALTPEVAKRRSNSANVRG